MKKVLVVGENSYIGRSFLSRARGKFDIELVGAKNDRWKSLDFSVYNSIIHCAGIAHVKFRRGMDSLYHSVNCDLAISVAAKAKEAGVGQFVFISSAAVFGNTREITPSTQPKPRGAYGFSKLNAEQKLKPLSGTDFKICIVRPPMVYGYNCKGNFQKLVKLAKILPVFPDIKNRRSMIYIGNLCAFLESLVEDDRSGIFHPQNNEYVCTAEMVKIIASAYNKKMRPVKFLNPLIFLLAGFIPAMDKMFGDFVYARIPSAENSYTSLKQSILDSI